jgi:XTP/dITP diphosphohydrolase
MINGSVPLALKMQGEYASSMRILFASGNVHKRKEIAQLFPGHEIILPEELGLPFEVEEDGSTFLENAMKKVDALTAAWPGAILADDSGICVDALGGAPGIHSARYGSEDGVELSSRERNALLVNAMRGKAERGCAFVCCMVLSLSQRRFIVAQESLEGILLEEPRGDAGFGYDPLVWVREKKRSVAELSDGEKNAISHRGRAARRILAMLDGAAE